MAEEYKRPGWYASPDGTPGERWWNGSGWSDSRRGGPAAAPPAPLPPVPTVVYSAENPAPQRPNPYATTVPTAAPTPAFTVAAPQNRMALAALVTGVIGLFGFSVLGPVGVILGLVSLSKVRQLKAQGAPTGSAAALAAVGVITGAIATVILIISVIGSIAAFTIDYSG